MRKTILTIASVAALAMPLFALAPTATAGATTPATPTCTKAAGTATFNPALPVIGNPATVKSTITVKGTESTCTGGGVKSATAAGTFKFAKPGNCTTLATASGGGTPGTVTLTWNTKKTSTIKTATITQPNKKNPLLAQVAGKITAGLFIGKTFTQQVTFALSASGGDCQKTPLKSVKYTQAKAGTIK
jgi:hypothetical protein